MPYNGFETVSTLHRFQPRLESLEERATPSATSRPISDFIQAQGTTSDFNFGVPGLPDEIAFSNSTSDILAGNGLDVRNDYTGRDAAFLAANSPAFKNPGTTISGTVVEVPLSDGRVQDTVNLQTHNAFVWAFKLGTDFSNGPTVFGAAPLELAAGATPALSDSNLQVVFKNTAPGAPLPDLVNDFILGNAPAGVELVSISFHATSRGMTPTGDLASLQVAETGVIARTPNLIRDGGFTAEVIHVTVRPNSSPLVAATPMATASLTTAPLSQVQASDIAVDDSRGSSLDGLLDWSI